MKRLGRCMLLLVLGAVLVVAAGCGKGETPVSHPEEGVRLVLEACQSAEYGKAARYFQGGVELWEKQPQFVREYLDHYCSYGKAVAFKVLEERVRGDLWLLHLTTYADPERKRGLRTMTWHFQQQGGGWIIIKVH